MEADKYCPCCGYDTFQEKERLIYTICPICFWEDDPFQFEDPELEGGANRVSLNQGQVSFDTFGASEKEMKRHCRAPNKKDKRKQAYNTGYTPTPAERQARGA